MNQPNNTFCINCGDAYDATLQNCPSCNQLNIKLTTPSPNAPLDISALSPLNDTKETTQTDGNSVVWVITLLLFLFFNGIAAHHFFVGKILSGLIMFLLAAVGSILMLLYGSFVGIILLSLFTVWCLYDFILIIIGRFINAQGKYITMKGLKDPNKTSIK